MFEWISPAQPRTKPLIYFWRGVARPFGSVVVGRHKRTAAKLISFNGVTGRCECQLAVMVITDVNCSWPVETRCTQDLECCRRTFHISRQTLRATYETCQVLTRSTCYKCRCHIRGTAQTLLHTHTHTHTHTHSLSGTRNSTNAFQIIDSKYAFVL